MTRRTRLPKPIRQFFVDIVLKCWIVMPARFKVWAFLNDSDISDL